MNGHLDERLSAYLDGELDGEALATAEAHLAACAECRAVLDGLRQLTRRARTLDDRPPERDLWTGIAERLAGTAPAVLPLRRRRFVFSLPQLAAAGIAIVALSSGAAVLLTHRSPAPAFPEPTSAALTAAPAGVASAKGIQDLEVTLAARRSVLDTATIRAVEQSLAVIDRAIHQAEAALAQDPNNMYLNNHLAHALDRKLEVLRRVTAMVAAS
jgi:anti-sigma factor RsiW